MSVTSVVTVEAVDEQTKRVIQEFLSMYFDGESHWCGAAETKCFPDVKLVFGKIEISDVESLPIIGVVEGQRASERKWGKSTGEDVKQDAEWTFTVWVDRAHEATVDEVILRGPRL
ncbi:MAG: hypothetical protein ABIH03_14835, partial [Pseudomonadota bacterium]